MGMGVGGWGLGVEDGARVARLVLLKGEDW